MTPSRESIKILLIGIILIIFVAIAGLFASTQSIWVDETTQLTGLALPFSEQFFWLIGRSERQLGVPPDRMPPLSYWVGALWVAVFGLSEATMRWFGIAATLAAAPALYLAGRMRGGAAGGLFVVAVVLLSPNTLVMAGEIRAYPLFLTLSAWSTWAFLRCMDLDTGNHRGRLAALSALLVLTAYTHYFGIVLAGALFATLIAERLLLGVSVRPVFSAVLGSSVGLVGLVPFVLGAVAVSGDADAATGSSLRGVAAGSVRLVLRLFLHGSHSVYLGVLLATGLALLGLGILVLGWCLRWFDKETSRARQSVFVLVPLFLAGVGLPILELQIGSFSVLAPHYNLWMVPLVAVFLGGAFAPYPACPWYPYSAKILGIIAVVGHLVAGSILLRYALLYSHGPGEWMADLWVEMNRPAIVHDGRGLWGHAYFPVEYLSGGDAVQLLSRNDGTLWRILPGRLDPITDESAYLSAFDSVLRVRVETMDSSHLAQIIRGENSCNPPAPSGVEPTNLEYFCAYTAAAVSIIFQPQP